MRYMTSWQSSDLTFPDINRTKHLVVYGPKRIFTLAFIPTTFGVVLTSATSLWTIGLAFNMANTCPERLCTSSSSSTLSALTFCGG